ncbi:hypothetical protein FNV43_RR15029 [Rhamnella rubrinervis]|uniref:Uncharacterized protein n=1 Tax=Rhamnella rubrinervis TaxID=2594499 RepID=A0A8K0GX52_9ROSA|nr:hypothetical protein FNV43_RR15029 [Rhamnella rubrinervis]
MFTGLNCGKFPKESEMRNLSYSFWTKDCASPGRSIKIDEKNNFTIIENDNLLEKYPWGNLCFDITIFSLRSKMQAGKHKTAYSLYGFPLAFQMWGFHVIPMVPTITPLGAFLDVRGMDVVLYFIRKRIDGNSGLFPLNVIIDDCFI